MFDCCQLHTYMYLQTLEAINAQREEIKSCRLRQFHLSSHEELMGHGLDSQPDPLHGAALAHWCPVAVNLRWRKIQGKARNAKEKTWTKNGIKHRLKSRCLLVWFLWGLSYPATTQFFVLYENKCELLQKREGINLHDKYHLSLTFPNTTNSASSQSLIILLAGCLFSQKSNFYVLTRLASCYTAVTWLLWWLIF